MNQTALPLSFSMISKPVISAILLHVSPTTQFIVLTINFIFTFQVMRFSFYSVQLLPLEGRFTSLLQQWPRSWIPSIKRSNKVFFNFFLTLYQFTKVTAARRTFRKYWDHSSDFNHCPSAKFNQKLGFSTQLQCCLTFSWIEL